MLMGAGFVPRNDWRVTPQHRQEHEIMGWTYICRPLRHDETPDSYLREKSGALNWSKHDDATGDRHEVIASAMVGSVWYGALKITYASTPGTSRVVALVFLTSQRKGEGFGWKDMSEDMGPNECDCPKRILDLLTPTESEYARDRKSVV